MHLLKLPIILCGLVVPALFSAAQDQETKQETATIETVPVTRQAVEVFETVEGVFESSEMHEVKTDLQTWTDLKVKEVWKEGAEVVENSILITFDSESIDKAIIDAELDVKNAVFAFEDAKLAMKEINETMVLDQQLADRTWKNAQEDYEYYLKILLPQSRNDLEYSEKTAGYYLEYSMDELDQLEQMYKEDELTEESEAIVLKRAERDVESARRSRDRTMRNIQRQRDFDIPREEKSRAESLQRQKIEYDKSKITLPIKKQRAEIALVKAELDLRNKQQKLDELNADRARMNLQANSAGILYYGKCNRGKWVGPTGTPTREIQVDSKLPVNKVVMTIVDPGQMMIRVDLQESQLSKFQPGLRGVALVKATQSTVDVTVDAVSSVPLSAGTFDCRLKIDALPEEMTIMPGMTCKASFRVYAEENAVTIPKASVFSDDGEISHFVFVVVDGEAEKRGVRLGPSTGTDVVVLEGLEAGMAIAKSRPAK